MKIKYKRVAVGGTFDVFHKGHKCLIDKAFEIGEEVLIGVSSDTLARSLGKEPGNSFVERATKVIEYLESRYPNRRYALYKLMDPYGPLVEDPGIDALVVSPETKKRGLEANKLRIKKGFREVRIVVVDWVLAEDGKPISSTRIKRGEIDEEGRLTRFRTSEKSYRAGD